MNRRPALAAAACTSILALAACGTSGTQLVASAPRSTPPASSTGSDLPSPSETPTITVQMQNAVAALGEQGRGPYADIWGALSLDAPGGRVILYATDPQRAAAMVEAAHKAHPDTGVEVKIVQCQHTAKDENAAVDRILTAQKAKPFLYDTYGLGPTMDGTGVRVYASAEALKSADFAKQLQDAAGAIPVKLVLGSKGTPAVAVATPRPSSS